MLWYVHVADRVGKAVLYPLEGLGLKCICLDKVCSGAHTTHSDLDLKGCTSVESVKCVCVCMG